MIKTTVFILIAVFILFYLPTYLASCIPQVPDQVIEEVRACYMPEPFKKPKLPTVKYTNVFEYTCFVDAEQKENARLREILLIQYANNITDLYNDARERCDPEGR